MKQPKCLKSKDGFVSIYAILWLSVLVPFLIFVFVNFTLMIKQKINYKNICDNAASSAVTYLDQDSITDGILRVRNSDAEKIVNNVIKNELNLNDDLTPNKDSLISQKPIIETKVYNDVPNSGLIVKTRFGNEIKLTKPSVIVVGEFPVSTGFKTTKGVTIKSYGVAQVQFNEEVD